MPLDNPDSIEVQSSGIAGLQEAIAIEEAKTREQKAREEAARADAIINASDTVIGMDNDIKAARIDAIEKRAEAGKQAIINKESYKNLSKQTVPDTLGTSNAITRITKEALKKGSQLYTGNSVTNLRIGKANCEKRLLDLSIILANQQANEKIIATRININSASIESAGARMNVNPKNAFAANNYEPNPPAAIDQAQYNALYQTYGMIELKATLNGIKSDIQGTLKLKEQLEKQLESIKDQLAEADKDYKNPLSFVGKILPPNSVDLEKDKIQKSEYVNIATLQQICVNYRKLSSNAKGDRGYSDDQAMATKLMALKSMFWSQAQSNPDYLKGGKKELSFKDPGSQSNLNILEIDLTLIMSVCKNDKIPEEVFNNIKAIEAISNNTETSKNISTVSDAPLSPEESVLFKNKLFSMTASRMGLSYKGSFELPDLLSSVKKRWKKKNTALLDLPQCPNIVEQYPTSSNSAVREASEVVANKTAEEGARAFTAAMAKAEKQREKINASSEIPADAPQWVKTYALRYGDLPSGNITEFGVNYYVTRVVSDSVVKAQEASAKSGTDKYVKKAGYGYQPVLSSTNPSILTDSTSVILYTLWEDKPNIVAEPELTVADYDAQLLAMNRELTAYRGTLNQFGLNENSDLVSIDTAYRGLPILGNQFGSLDVFLALIRKAQAGAEKAKFLIENIKKQRATLPGKTVNTNMPL